MPEDYVSNGDPRLELLATQVDTLRLEAAEARGARKAFTAGSVIAATALAGWLGIESLYEIPHLVNEKIPEQSVREYQLAVNNANGAATRATADEARLTTLLQSAASEVAGVVAAAGHVRADGTAVDSTIGSWHASMAMAGNEPQYTVSLDAALPALPVVVAVGDGTGDGPRILEVRSVSKTGFVIAARAPAEGSGRKDSGFFFVVCEPIR